MNMFATTAPAEADVQAETNYTGSFVKPADYYVEAEVKMAYGLVSSGGAVGLCVTLDLGDAGEHEETFYVLNKEGKAFSEKNGVKRFLPGHNQTNALCGLTVAKPLAEIPTESKLVEIYDYDAKKKVPQEVPVVVELIGQKINVGLLQIKTNKQKLNNGKYEDTNDVREYNEVDKFFRVADNMTVPELMAGGETAEYFETWIKSNKGKVRDKYKEVAQSGTSGAFGAPAAAASAPAKSMFGNK